MPNVSWMHYFLSLQTHRFVNTMNSVPCFLTGNKKSYLYGLTKKDTYAFNPKGLDNK